MKLFFCRCFFIAINCMFINYSFGQTVPAKLPKIDFDYPEDITDTAKKKFEKKFRQGHVIYTSTCGNCHNKTINGKQIIPDFSLPQLMDYEMRMSEDHGEKLTDRFISDEELERVIIFLRYKKKSGVYVRPGPKQ